MREERDELDEPMKCKWCGKIKVPAKMMTQDLCKSCFKKNI